MTRTSGSNNNDVVTQVRAPSIHTRRDLHTLVSAPIQADMPNSYPEGMVSDSSLEMGETALSLS